MRVYGLILFFVLISMVTAFASLPLSLITNALDSRAKDVQYNRAVGTIWDGTLTDVQVAGESIGQLNFKFQTQSIFKFSPKFGFEFSGAVGRGFGEISIGMNKNVSIENVSANIQLNAFQHLDAQLRQTPSILRMSISDMSISLNGECLTAIGTMDTDLLTSVGRTWGWDGPEMRGDIKCQENSFVVSFVNDAGPDKITAQASVRNDTKYDVSSRVVTENHRLSNALLSYGFEVYDKQGVFEYSKSTY